MKKFAKLAVGFAIALGVIVGSHHIIDTQQTKVSAEVTPYIYCDPGRPGGC